MGIDYKTVHALLNMGTFFHFLCNRGVFTFFFSHSLAGWESRGETKVGFETAGKVEERHRSRVSRGLCALRHRQKASHVHLVESRPERKDAKDWLFTPSRQGMKMILESMSIRACSLNTRNLFAGLETRLGSGHPVQSSSVRIDRRRTPGKITRLPAPQLVRQSLPHQRLRSRTGPLPCQLCQLVARYDNRISDFTPFHSNAHIGITKGVVDCTLSCSPTCHSRQRPSKSLLK